MDYAMHPEPYMVENDAFLADETAIASDVRLDLRVRLVSVYQLIQVITDLT